MFSYFLFFFVVIDIKEAVEAQSDFTRLSSPNGRRPDSVLLEVGENKPKSDSQSPNPLIEEEIKPRHPTVEKLRSRTSSRNNSDDEGTGSRPSSRGELQSTRIGSAPNSAPTPLSA